MKKIFFISLITCFLFSCKNSVDKANLLVDGWVSQNMSSEITHKPVFNVKALEFTLEESEHLQSLQTELDSALVYYEIKINNNVLDESLFASQAEHFASMFDELNQQIKQHAMERVLDLNDEIANYIAKNKSRKPGDKGYSAVIKYQEGEKTGEITFYFDNKVEQIIEARKTSDIK